jgi:hypothetical protein
MPAQNGGIDKSSNTGIFAIRPNARRKHTGRGGLVLNPAETARQEAKPCFNRHLAIIAAR